MRLIKMLIWPVALWHLCGGSSDEEMASIHRLRSSEERKLQNQLQTVGDNLSYALQRCQGDCDNDNDCAGNLICFQRNGNEAVPGCSGDSSSMSGWDFCINPPSNSPSSPSSGSSTSLVYRGNDGNGPFPLGRCEGDCDSDSDCRGSLRCFQRSGTERVPGCSGTGRSGTDYCYDPGSSSQPGPSPAPPSSERFRIKMYWERGYYWQEETVERRWCLQCEGSACQAGEEIEVRTCGGGNTYFNFLPNGSGQVQIRIDRTNLCLQLLPPRTIQVRNCDSSNANQFFGPGQGSFTGSRFELVSANGFCLTQHHHPRSGENIGSVSCATARGSDTSFYNKY